jgi:hypothetical protein
MDHLVRLQLTNLLKKYDYLCGEFEAKSEISAISQGVFWDNIERVVRGDDRLGEAVKIDDPYPRSEGSVLSSGIMEDKNRDVDEDIKSLYRTVAKITHPDKVRNEYLNKLYVDATRMVRDNDRIGLYGLAISLGIEVSIPDGMYEDLVAKINEIEAKIRFLESSYHMRWYYSDRQTKIDLVCEYIEKNMLRLSEA